MYHDRPLLFFVHSDKNLYHFALKQGETNTMVNAFNSWLNYPKYFRISFFIVLACAIVLNVIQFGNESNMFIFYILSSIFLGVGFYDHSVLFIIIVTTLLVICRFFLINDSNPTFATFLTYLFTYLLISFISRYLMRYAQTVRMDILELTTALANALDSRDPYTHHHSENVSMYAVKIAEKMNLPKELCTAIRIGGLLHDIGKIGIPEHILTKKDKLTEEEYSIIKSHPYIGYNMISHISNFRQSSVLDIVLYHHERFDGTGYPRGLSREEIPLCARIVAVADTFDAMTSRRVYREELDLSFTLDEIRNSKGTQFDPEVVDALLYLVENRQIIVNV